MAYQTTKNLSFFRIFTLHIIEKTNSLEGKRTLNKQDGRNDGKALIGLGLER